MRPVQTVTLLIIGLLATASLAVADEIIITHHSGKVQTIPLSDSSDPVEQISIRRTEKTVSSTAAKTVAPAILAPTETIAAPIQPEKSADKPKLKVKWAEPVDTM